MSYLRPSTELALETLYAGLSQAVLSENSQSRLGGFPHPHSIQQGVSYEDTSHRGAGRVGAEVVKELKKRDADVRILARKADVKSLRGVEVVVGDLLDPVSIEKALEGVGKLYLLNAVTPDELTQGLIAFDLAKKLKLSHIVYHSVFRADHVKDVPHFASKLAIEGAIRAYDVPFTIIRPNYFFQNAEKSG